MGTGLWTLPHLFSFLLKTQGGLCRGTTLKVIVACEQALLVGRTKRAARERASERLSLRVSCRVPLAAVAFVVSHPKLVKGGSLD